MNNRAYELARSEWYNILYFDKSRFSGHIDNRRIFILSKNNARNNPVFTQEHARFGSVGVVMYAGIHIGGCTDLHIIWNGALTGRRCMVEILRPIVVPYAVIVMQHYYL